MVFERFTDQARRVVVLAQEEARLAGAAYIGTEHVLLGLIHEGGGVAAKALEQLGVSLEAVRVCVEEIIGTGSPTSGHIEYTPRAKKVLELSLREALQLGHNYIGTEHILLGLIREGEGVAAQVLVKLGADLSRVRQQVIQLLSGYAEGRSPGAETGADDKLGVAGYLENLRVRAREYGVRREEHLIRAIELLTSALELAVAADTNSGPAQRPRGESRPFSDLQESGLLWLINRALLHPRGFALAVLLSEGEAVGWELLGDGKEVWTMGDGIDEDALFAKVQELFAGSGAQPGLQEPGGGRRGD